MRFPVHNLVIFAACILWITPAPGNAEDEALPVGFRFVGNYLFEKRVKIRNGTPFSVASKPYVCRVYTDGITVRLYGEGGSESYTSFTIHRNDGVMVGIGTANVETVPGVQAHTLVGNVLRQLTLTDERLVLTKFPALSDVVEVTYANRRITITRSE